MVGAQRFRSTENFGMFWGPHDLICYHVPLKRVHSSSLCSQTKALFALAQGLASSEIFLNVSCTCQTNDDSNGDKKPKGTKTCVLIPPQKFPNNRDGDHYNDDHRPE